MAKKYDLSDIAESSDLSDLGEEVQEPISEIPPSEKPGIAERIWEGATSKIPGLSQAADIVQNKIPDMIAEESGRLSTMAGPLGPIVQQKGIEAAGAISLAGSLIPQTPFDVGMYLVGGGGLGKAGKVIASRIPAKAKDIIFTKVAIPAMEKAAAITGSFAGATGDILADVSGALFGKNPEIIRALYKKPGAVWSKANELFGIKRQEILTQKIKEGLDIRGKQFQQLEEEFAGFVKPSKAARVKTSPIIDDIVGEMEKRGHYIPKAISGKNPVAIGRFPENSTEAKAIFEKLDLIKKNPDMEFGQALNLRRQLDDMINYGVEGTQGLQQVSGEGNRVLQLMRRRLNSRMRDSIPADIRPSWDRANFQYKQAITSFNELKKQVIKGDPKGTEAKFLQLIKDGRYDDEIMTRANKLGEETAKAFDDIHDIVVAKQFKPWAQTGSGGSLLSSGIIPTLPRPLGYGVSAAGGLSNLVSGTGKAIMANPEATAASTVGLKNILNNNQ